ncbi:chorismate-binding protein [Croceivirga lutea]|uniref:chorismate-binding protein n=1 Tax=Croceivirga lutea TaxID=1775167 RepID=UPI001639B26D|nr:chorismate-binding protein [Croceivirga lutea]
MHLQKTSNILEQAVKHSERKLPFVLFRKPGEELILGVFQDSKELFFFNDYNASGFIFAPFDIDEAAIKVLPDRVLQEKYKEVAPLTLNAIKVNQDGKASYLQKVDKAIHQIANGAFKKVVFSRRIDVSTKRKSSELFQNLLANYGNAFCYWFYHPKVGEWFGATPERFLQIKEQKLQTTSLAGTLPFKENELPDWSSKELDEQQIVTDDIVGKLAKLNLKATIKGPVNTKAGKLWHLKSTIDVDLNSEEDIAEIIKSLHPTPAVCGMPTQPTKAYILENEGYNRGYYTGFLGDLNVFNNTVDLYVNLRCMSKHDSKVNIYVGGGLTKDSIPEKEWQETVNKSKTMLTLL